MIVATHTSYDKIGLPKSVKRHWVRDGRCLGCKCLELGEMDIPKHMRNPFMQIPWFDHHTRPPFIGCVNMISPGCPDDPIFSEDVLRDKYEQGWATIPV